MPEFEPNTGKTAVAPVTVAPAGLQCTAELFLGPDDNTKVASSGPVAFTSTREQQEIRLQVSMPGSEGRYEAFLDVLAEGILVSAYKAIEDVIITVPVAGPETVGIRLLNPPAGAQFWRYSIWFEDTNMGRGTDIIPIDQVGYVSRIYKPGFLTALYFYSAQDSDPEFFISGMQSWEDNPEYGKYGIEYRPRVYVAESGLYEYDWPFHTLTRIG